MKLINLLLLFLLSAGVVTAQGPTNIVDLCTGRNNDGTLMPESDATDSDWSYIDPGGIVSTPITRYAATSLGWSSATIGMVSGASRWITGSNATTGYHYYVNKEFEIPAGVTGTLNLRSLSFVRNWTFLVKKNTDGTETETQITATSYLSDGAKGWLNSRSPEVINYTLPAGQYYIKVKLYTDNGAQRQAIDVNANVQYTPVVPCTAPAVPTLSNIVQPTCAVSTGSFTITNYSSTNIYAITPNTGVTQSANIITAPVGIYTVTATAGGCTSAPSVNVSVSPAQTTTLDTVDLRTGIDNAGQLMVGGQRDSDWTEYDASGNLIGNKYAQVPMVGNPAWSAPQIPGSSANTRWLEMVNNPSAGTTTFLSKRFTVPTFGRLLLKALSANASGQGANEVYLIQIDNNGSTQETLLAKSLPSPPYTTYLQSGSPAVVDTNINAGTYRLKVIVTGASGKICVNARVSYSACANPVTPTFAPIPAILTGQALVLPTTSLNGVAGTWKPAIVSSTASGVYIYYFYPNSGCCATSATLSVAVKDSIQDWTKAPNSYIFDPGDVAHDGIYIPVKKAYAMWKDTNQYFGLKTPITGGAVSATVYWEDVSGLIKTAGPTSFNLNIIGSGDTAKIEVPIDKTKGKGNAVIVLTVNGEIKWSWHIWVTDNPERGSQYRQGYETGVNNVPFSQINGYEFKWMDRNLGATNASFLGNDWNKSSGMMYQWGRKDPIPPLTYKDGTGYEVTGEAALSTTAKSFSPIDRTRNQPHPFADAANPGNPAYGWLLRPFDTAAQNIRYAIQHPLTIISYKEWTSQKYATWFSKQEYRIPNTAAAGQDPNSVSWDLWSDNTKGKPSNYNTGDPVAAADAKSYELKSAYDPCPCNWRIPSHYGSLIGANAASPWGRQGSGGNDDMYNSWDNNHPATNGFFLSPLVNGGKPSSVFVPGITNNVMPDTKAYIGLGFDLTNQGNRNLGMLPITGGYVFTGPNQTGDMYNASPKLDFMNNTSVGALPTATYGPYNGLRALVLRAEAYKVPDSNKFMFNTSDAIQTNGAGPVRCMADPNSALVGNFATEYIDAQIAAVPDYKTWAKDPNSYIVMTNSTTEQKINLRKAYAMQRLYLSADNQPPNGIRSVDVVWTSNANLLSGVSITGTGEATSDMVVKLNAAQTGNAVVALRIGSTGTAVDPIIWSWHIWAPETDPTTAVITYTTEKTVASPGNNIVNPTKNSAMGPLTTTFMDRNLGALIAFPNTGTVSPPDAQKSIGMHYQWGRKDPLPSFLDQTLIYKGTGASAISVDAAQYNNDVRNGGSISKMSVYGSSSDLNIIGNMVDKKHEKIRRVVSFAAQNPLTYLYNDVNHVDWVSDKAGLEAERWGHATEKSPFDPCPAGWRIPDMSYAFDYNTNWVAADGTKGTSPWYLGDIQDPANAARWGVNQIVNNPIGVYKGTLVGNLGFQFRDAAYAIGNYPFSGIRGVDGIGVSNSFNGTGGRLGIWTASQTSDMGGHVFGLSISDSNVIARMATSIRFVPHQAMSCRCAKIQYDADNKEIGRYDPNAIPVPQTTGMKATNELGANAVQQMLQNNALIVFPNPVTDVLRINATDNRTYYYQLYDALGRLAREGQFVNMQTDISSLTPGVYVLRINNSEKAIKIIKQ